MTKEKAARAIFLLMILGNVLVFLLLWLVGLPLINFVSEVFASYGAGAEFAPYMRGIVVGLSIATCVVFSVLQLKKIKRLMGGLPQQIGEAQA